MRGKWIFCVLLGLLLSALSYAKSLIIGVDQINPPMSIRTDGVQHFIGFEIDIMNEICKRAHLDCVYQSIRASRIIDALEQGQIDCAIDSIIIPKFRLHGLVMSLPYLPSYGQFMTLASSPIKSMDDIPKKSIGVRLGAFQVNVDSDMYIKHIFIEPPKIKPYYTISELLAALEEEEVDIIFTNKYATNYWYNTNQGLYKFIGEPAYLGSGYGIMATVQHESVIAKMNLAIQAMMEDGTYDKLYQRYFANFQ